MKLKCPKCRKGNIKNRFGFRDENGNVTDYATQKKDTIPVDSDEYQVHFDTLYCSDCLYWDFDSAFY